MNHAVVFAVAAVATKVAAAIEARHESVDLSIGGIPARLMGERPFK